jgi:transposase-like protein
LADQAVDGHLPDLLKSWRDQGLSYGAIARELVMRGAVVSDEGVRSWCQRLLVEAPV